MKIRLLVTGMLGITALGACTPKQVQQAQQPSPAAQQLASQLPPGRVYAFDSSAQGGCPALSWHMVLQQGGVLDGLIAWNNMQSIAHVSGTVNPQTRAFQLAATEVGGQGRTANITGTVNPNNGYLTANIQGPNVNCRGVEVPWFSPYAPSAG